MKPKNRPSNHGIYRYLVPGLLVLLPASGWAQRVTATVAVGANPVAVAVNPVTDKIYVANCVPSGSRSPGIRGTVTVIDGHTNIQTEVAVGICPSAVAVNPLTNKIYVANYGKFNLWCGSCINYGSVTVIDGATNSTLTITNSQAKFPRAVALNSVTNKIYLANNLSQNVTVIDGASNSITTVPTTGIYPYDIAVDSATNKIYVTSFLIGAATSRAVSVIDGFTNRATMVTDPKAADPFAVAVNPVTNKIYVANLGNLGKNGTNVGSGTVIDGATRLTRNIADPNVIAPHVVAVDPTLNKIYFANANSAGISGNGGVTVVDGFTNSFVNITHPNMTTDGNVFDTANIAVDTVMNRVYLANASSNNVMVFDGFTNSTTTIADLHAKAPRAVAVNPVTGKVYVVNSGSNNVTVIDGLQRNRGLRWLRHL